MKLSIWDILTGVVVLASACLACAFTQIFFNPAASYNPFPPPTALAPLMITIPSATATVGIRVLPATWTPTSPPESSATPAMILKPSSTVLPTATLFFMPTATPLPTITRTPAATRTDGRCQVVDESPKDNAEYSPGQEFDKSWTLRNLGNDPWRSDSIDIRFLSGTRMHTGADAYDLSRDISKNDTYQFGASRMRAPNSPGTYTAQWAFVSGDKSVCNFYMKIIVK